MTILCPGVFLVAGLAVMFFVGSDIVRVVLLVLFPAITLFILPG